MPRPALTGFRLWLAKQVVIGLLAAIEEVIWRGFVLVGLERPAGVAAALVLSSLAFAAVHRNARFGHVLCGLVFGGLYVGLGSLAAAWAAHAAYNASISATVEARRFTEARRCIAVPSG